MNHGDAKTPAIGRRLACLAVLAAAFSFSACAKNSPDVHEEWEDIAAATGPGQVVVVNESEKTLTRLWFSPSHTEDLWPGATPEGFDALAPGATFEQEIPMGWWDVWFEADDGSDVLLHRTWFGNNGPTNFVIEEGWWNLGDWITESDEAAEPAADSAEPTAEPATDDAP